MGQIPGRRLYESLPPFAQDVALSLFGLRNVRRLRQWRQVLSGLQPSERWSPEEQRRFTSGRLREVLVHAIRHVPRYAGFSHLLPDLQRADAPVLDLLREFPPITRQDVIAEPDAFLSRAFARESLTTTITSGTTGTPFTSWLEPGAFLTSDALWWRRTAWAGHVEGDWIARLVGDPVIPLSERDPRRVYRVAWTDRRLYFSTYHLNAETAPRIAAVLARRRPAFFMGYPSALDTLARLAGPVPGLDEWRPKAILFSSEPLYDHQREAIRNFVDAPIRGLYGCAERIVSAAQCASGAYHLSVVDGYVEGQFEQSTGHVPAIITGLLNLAMPLIRFRLGDALRTLGSGTCECGRTLPRIDPVVTKHEDAVLTPSGRVISPSILTWAFKELEGLQKSQIIQRAATEVEVLVQCTPDALPPIEATLRERLDALFFGEMQVSVTRVAVLEVTAAGKTRFVVNEWRRGAETKARG